jgi:hypothetical protein
MVYRQYPALTDTDPRWSPWTSAFSEEDVDKPRKGFVAKEELVPKHKFGVEVPKNVRQALELDRINGNNLWYEAIQREMTQLLDYRTFSSKAYQQISHQKFYVRRKTWKKAEHY